jgi:hypothetical protein
MLTHTKLTGGQHVVNRLLQLITGKRSLRYMNHQSRKVIGRNFRLHFRVDVLHRGHQYQELD